MRGTLSTDTQPDSQGGDDPSQFSVLSPQFSLLVRRWWKATRPRTLSASVAPVLVGTAAALPDAFSLVRLLLALAGAVAIQAGTNMLNEHFDHVQGLDLTRERRGDMVIQTGEMAHGALFRGGIVALLLGALCGLVLVYLTGPVLLLVVLFIFFAAYA